MRPRLIFELDEGEARPSSPAEFQACLDAWLDANLSDHRCLTTSMLAAELLKASSPPAILDWGEGTADEVTPVEVPGK